LEAELLAASLHLFGFLERPEPLFLVKPGNGFGANPVHVRPILLKPNALNVFTRGDEKIQHVLSFPIWGARGKIAKPEDVRTNRAQLNGTMAS
jgi:hypothetical protein